MHNSLLNFKLFLLIRGSHFPDFHKTFSKRQMDACRFSKDFCAIRQIYKPIGRGEVQSSISYWRQRYKNNGELAAPLIPRSIKQNHFKPVLMSCPCPFKGENLGWGGGGCEVCWKILYMPAVLWAETICFRSGSGSDFKKVSAPETALELPVITDFILKSKFFLFFMKENGPNSHAIQYEFWFFFTTLADPGPKLRYSGSGSTILHAGDLFYKIPMTGFSDFIARTNRCNVSRLGLSWNFIFRFSKCRFLGETICSNFAKCSSSNFAKFCSFWLVKRSINSPVKFS